MKEEDSHKDGGLKVLMAKEIFVYMKKSCCLSRNARLAWYLSNLNTIPQNEPSGKDDDYEVVSLIPMDDLDSRDRSSGCSFYLSPTTLVSYIARRYRMAFVLDASPSLASLDVSSTGVLFDKLFLSLRNILKSLIKPFCPPGSSRILQPEIFVSIIVYSTVTKCSMKQVLLHGCKITQSNIDVILSSIKKHLMMLECNIATAIKDLIADRNNCDMGNVAEKFYLDKPDSSGASGVDSVLVSTDASLVIMLRHGILALQLMPEDSVSEIVVVTDGVIGFPDPSSFDVLMHQLRQDSIACSFVQIGDSYHPRGHSLGYTPYTELMQFITSATQGTYFSMIPRLTETGDPAMNSVHRSLLCCGFLKTSFDKRHLSLMLPMSDNFDGMVSYQAETESRLWTVPMVKRKHSDNNFYISLAPVVASRIREGYLLRNVVLNKNHKGENQIEIQLVLPWRDTVRLHYIVTSPWPQTQSNSKKPTHVEVATEAPCNFFLDLSMFASKYDKSGSRTRTSFRKAMVVRYLQYHQGIGRTDQFLMNLHSFNTNPVYYNLPECLRQGYPLYLSSTGGELHINQQLSNHSVFREVGLNDFATFWKQLVLVDTPTWQKWMDVYRIDVILEHDAPVGKYLHVPNPSGRFNVVYCRQSMEVFLSFLQSCTSFILMDRHSYVRLLFNASHSDKVPSSFYILRVDTKLPYVVLRIGFFGDRSEKLHSEIVQQLRMDLRQLRMPHTKNLTVQKANGGRKHSGAKSTSGKNNQRLISPDKVMEFPCCTVTQKSVEKILIRYEKVPRDFNKTELIPSIDKNGQQVYQTATKSALNLLSTLSNLLCHRRWIWSLQTRGPFSFPMTMSVACNILSNLTKKRLLEGFHFVHSNSGILNLALELPMLPPNDKQQNEHGNDQELSTCLVQFIIFPPHTTNTSMRDSYQSSCAEDGTDEQDQTFEGEGELQLVTECWIEPQDGVVGGSSQKHKQFLGLDYLHIAEALFSVDLECISTAVTFENLVHLCQNPTALVPNLAGTASLTLTEMSVNDTELIQTGHLDHSIDHISFPFDLFILASKCQQVELLFSVFNSYGTDVEKKTDTHASNSLMILLLIDHLKSLHDRELSLMSNECLQLLKIISKRERDLVAHPLPFDDPNLCDRMKIPDHLSNEESKKSNLESVGRWKCFLRLLNATQLIVTFVPSSYNDLLLLTCDNNQERENKVANGSGRGESILKRQSSTCVDETTDASGTDSCSFKETELNVGEETGKMESNLSSEEQNTPEKRTVPVLPIYVYNCSITDICDQTSNSKQSDIYEDITFADDFLSSHSKSPAPSNQPDCLHLPPDTGLRKISECDSSSSRERCKRNSEELYKNQDELKQHCTLISEAYLRCFVTGIYESLCEGRWIGRDDVLAAIYNICEESSPLEINLTKFMQSSCRQLQLILDWSSAVPDDSLKATFDPVSVNIKKETTEETVKVVDRPPNHKIPTTMLFEGHHACESIPGLHDLIRHKFSQILLQHFRPIPSNPEYLYYYPSEQRSTFDSLSMDVEALPSLIAEQTEGGETCKAYESNQFLSEGDVDFDNKQGKNLEVRAESIISSSESVGEEFTKQERIIFHAKAASPLFIHLVCSIRLPQPGNLRSLPVESLPLCLSELKGILLDCSEIDMSSLKLTLDIICLSLPPAPPEDLKEMVGRPCYDRLTSFNSQISNTDSTDEDTDDAKSVVNTSDNGIPNDTSFGLNRIGHLPQSQQSSIQACKEQINWLIEDEIVSSSRLIIPVREKTLCNAVSHIKQFPGRPLCMATEVPLQFVFGPEQSIHHFIEQFEKLRVNKYQMFKVGIFYYFCKAKTCENVLEHAQALSSALQSLHGQPTMGGSPLAAEHVLSDSAAKVDTDVGTDALDTPITDLKLNDFYETSEGSFEAAAPKLDDSREGSSGSRDIQILVSRPSPIKEVPAGAARQKQETLGEQSNTTEYAPLPMCNEMVDVDLNEHVTPIKTSSKQNLFSTPCDDSLPPLGGQDSMLSLQGGEYSSLQDVSISSECISEEQQRAVSDPNHSVRSMSVSGANSNVMRDESHHWNMETKRVRPISGPAGFEAVRKLPQLLLEGFESAKNHPLCSLSQQNVGKEVFVDSKVIKRAHSTMNFERARVEKQKCRHASQGTTAPSGCNTPLVDCKFPLRSRNASGLETPISAVDTSSITTGEGGYEADSSDSDEDGAMMSFNDSMLTVKRRLLVPDFWQILQVQSDRIEVYFHARDLENAKSTRQNKEFNKQVIDGIKQICHITNQKLLLNDLFEKRYCNKLLVPEADEDVKWSKDKQSTENVHHRRKVVKSDDSSDSEGDVSGDNRYLAATTQFKPGHFMCDCVWQTHFTLHPRLKANVTKSGISPGLKALVEALSKFLANNRRNMYVIKENLSGSVFYISLSEVCQESKLPVGQLSTDSDDTKLTASQNPSHLSMALQRIAKQDEESRPPSSAGLSDLEASGTQLSLSLSMRSANFTPKSKTEERVTMSVYGICSVGSEISQDLVEVLQKKLDEVVLETFWLNLSRNPNTKLSIEDVQFIQKPYTQPVQQTQFMFPTTALLHQFAFGFYLRQNLQTFLFTPKYVDPSRPENNFQNYVSEAPAPIPESDVFLYVRPQQASSKGIACIHLSFVDGRGSPVQLISSPRPSPFAYKEQLDKSLFDAMLLTSRYEPDPSSKSPGPTSLIQFSIWQCGSLDLTQLTEMLLQSIKHAVNDLVLEYRLLTAPICEFPLHYLKGIDSPLHSAPVSPSFCSNNSDSRQAAQFREDSSRREQGMDIGRSVIKTPKEPSSSIQTLLFDIFKARSDSVDGEPFAEVSVSSNKEPNSSEVELSAELIKKIQLYESGEKGTLNPVFLTSIPDWLDFCTKQNVPSVAKSHYMLNSRLDVEIFLKELPNIVSNISQDITLSSFRDLSGCGLSNESNYEPFNLAKPHSKEQENFDLVKSGMNVFSSKNGGYVIVGRNLDQWRFTLDYQFDENFAVNLPMPSPSTLKVQKKYQKFQPMDDDLKTNFGTSRLSVSSSPSVEHLEKAYIPRQRLLLVHVSHKVITLYLYNWAADLASSLERQFTRHVQWHNARAHILTCLAMQKMGLFQHALFGEPPTDVYINEANPFLMTIGDIDQLVKCTVLPVNQLKMRTRSGSVAVSKASSSMHSLISQTVPLFDGLFRENQPMTPMHKSSFGVLRDKLHKHGAQALQMRSIEKKENEKREKLLKLFSTWLQRNVSIQQTVSDDLLEMVKKSSRLIHHVSTPLLFSPHWLKESYSKLEPVKRQSSQLDQFDRKLRSRHSSGASVRSKRSDSIEYRKKASTVSLEQLMKAQCDEKWHFDLCCSFANHYIQYLQSMSFVPVKPDGHNFEHDQKFGEKISGKSSLISSNMTYAYLQKTLTGGIIIIEIGFLSAYFYISVYALECSRLQINTNPQLTVMFTDECDKLKDLTHLHSFAHDFHLRLIQSYLSGETVLSNGYHLSGLLREIVSYFPNEPSFSWNYVHEETTVISCGVNGGQQLFEYMRSREALHGMKALCMTPFYFDDDLSIKDKEYALVAQLVLSPEECESYGVDFQTADNFNVSWILTLNSSTALSELDLPSLNLKYWVVLTNKHQIFPKQNLEKKLAMDNQNPFSAAIPCCGRRTSLNSISESLTERFRLETTDYLGYSNVHQMPLHSLLLVIVRIVKDKISQIVEDTKSLCHRDHLWMRLLVSDEDSKRRRKTGEVEETKHPAMAKLNCNEFEDLLGLVTKKNICEIDPELKTILELPISTYHQMARFLVSRYPEAHRYLSTICEGGSSLQYVVILNPMFLDVFILMSVDDRSKDVEFCLVYRDMNEVTEDSSPIVQQHLESFITACTYYLWTSLLT